MLLAGRQKKTGNEFPALTLFMEINTFIYGNNQILKYNHTG